MQEGTEYTHSSYSRLREKFYRDYSEILTCLLCVRPIRCTRGGEYRRQREFIYKSTQRTDLSMSLLLPVLAVGAKGGKVYVCRVNEWDARLIERSLNDFEPT
jgi:hypothetical protein